MDYYIIPDIEELAVTTDSDRQAFLRRRIAANIGDRDALMQILGVSTLDPDSFYPDQVAPELTTTDTIDAFLDKFGGNLPDAPAADGDADEGPIVPVAPAVDYLTLLAMEEKDPEATVPEGAKPAPETPALRVDRPEIPQEAPNLTESFAKVLIKNGNYLRAYEILEQLHLKNPEKSIYFADQMRFLRKLIAIDRLKSSRP